MCLGMTIALPAEKCRRRRRHVGKFSLDVVTNLNHHIAVLPGEIELLRSILREDINALFQDS